MAIWLRLHSSVHCGLGGRAEASAAGTGMLDRPPRTRQKEQNRRYSPAFVYTIEFRLPVHLGAGQAAVAKVAGRFANFSVPGSGADVEGWNIESFESVVTNMLACVKSRPGGFKKWGDFK